jgi:hypothetical protein
VTDQPTTCPAATWAGLTTCVTCPTPEPGTACAREPDALLRAATARTTPDNPAASNNETDNPLREQYAAALWEAAEHNIIAEWICCEPLDPSHELCAQGYAAMRMIRALIIDDPEAYKPAPLADAVLAVRDRRMEQLAAGRATWKAKAEEIERDRDRLLTESPWLRASDEDRQTAEATIARIRQLADRWENALTPDRRYAEALRAALDGPADTSTPAPGHATVTIRIHAPSDDNAGQWAETIRDLVTAEHGQDMRLDIRITPPPAEEQPADTCRPVQVDGETIRVHGARPLTGLELGYAAQIVAAAQRRHAANPPTVPDGDGTESALTRRIRAEQRGATEHPVPCETCTRTHSRGFTLDALAHPGCADALAGREASR